MASSESLWLQLSDERLPLNHIKQCPCHQDLAAYLERSPCARMTMPLPLQWTEIQGKERISELHSQTLSNLCISGKAILRVNLPWSAIERQVLSTKELCLLAPALQVPHSGLVEAFLQIQPDVFPECYSKSSARSQTGSSSQRNKKYAFSTPSRP